MRLIFFGTSAGVPTKNRYTSAIGLRVDNSNDWILFDCGEGTQFQIMRSSFSISKLKYIFITHLHGDHIYGIFGLLASRGMMQIKTPLTIYAPSGAREMILSVVKLSSLHLPFELKIVEIDNLSSISLDNNIKIDIVKLSHSIDSFGFVVKQRIIKSKLDIHKLKSLGVEEGYLYGKLQRGEDITIDGKKITSKSVVKKEEIKKRVIIGGDNDEPQRFLEYKSIDLMVHEATYIQRDFDNLKRLIQHTTARDLSKVASKMGVKSLILTHISPRYDGGRERELIDEAKSFFEGEVILAEDLMELEV